MTRVESAAGSMRTILQVQKEIRRKATEASTWGYALSDTRDFVSFTSEMVHQEGTDIATAATTDEGTHAKNSRILMHASLSSLRRSGLIDG
jgi:hypothetical protein